VAGKDRKLKSLKYQKVNEKLRPEANLQFCPLKV
jgi:hypothetical protein